MLRFFHNPRQAVLVQTERLNLGIFYNIIIPAKWYCNLLVNDVISHYANAGNLFLEKSSFVRLLFSLIAGILVQWFCQLMPVVWYAMFAGALLILISFFYFPLFTRYRLGFLNGVATLLPFIAIGALLVWHHDIRNTKNWIGNHIKGDISFIATLEETPVEKTKSFKADASITHLVENEKVIPVKGKIILYFKKDSLRLPLEYGSQIIFKKPLQEIKNSGNPGGFDYKRYSLFHGITHQVYLASEEFISL